MAIDFDGLRMVIEAVRSEPDESFDMGAWVSNAGCGTSACAIGWFCLQNPADGLKLKHGIPQLGELCSWQAIHKRFGLNCFESCMFAKRDKRIDNTRAAVIARIEAFIAEKEKDSNAHS